jgi:integrase
MGGNGREWKELLNKLGQIVNQNIPVGKDMVKLVYDVEKLNRFDCPIHINPQESTFTDIAIHGLLRQRLQPSTVEKHLRYARFMENHTVKVDFRNPNQNNFIRHMDYREQHDKATPCALTHEWKAMQMFLKAYGMPIWDYKAPSIPQSHKRVLPYPETVNKFFNFKYSENEYETALYQYMFFFGFMVGVRIPSELIELKVSDVFFDSKKRGYVIITETKKHRALRTVIPEKAVLNSKVHKSLKNWIEHWRPKVANEYSGDSLFLQPSGKPFCVRHLGQELSIRGKQIWKDFHPYDMRHWCAVARLIKTKVETGNFDCYTVKNWLGHTNMKTTEGYIRYAEQYYHELPVDWIACALKSHKNVRGKHRQKNQQNAFLGSVEPILSERVKWACPNLNRGL